MEEIQQALEKTEAAFLAANDAKQSLATAQASVAAAEKAVAKTATEFNTAADNLHAAIKTRYFPDAA